MSQNAGRYLLFEVIAGLEKYGFLYKHRGRPLVLKRSFAAEI